MPDFRVFAAPAASAPADITLSAEESHHLVAVNRAREGDAVIAFDGRGTEWTCELAAARKQAAVLRVRSTRRHAPLPFRITLAQALPKGAAMDGIVRKATEIGAAVIVPLEADRSQVHLERERSDRKVEKWQVAALEAAKQCGNPFLPEIRPVQPAAGFIPAPGEYDLKLIASLQPGARSLKAVLREAQATAARGPERVLWLIGPEGDFSPAELQAADAAGYQAVTLGPLVLRCETAAVYALSILSYELLAATAAPTAPPA